MGLIELLKQRVTTDWMILSKVWWVGLLIIILLIIGPPLFDLFNKWRRM